MTVFGNFMALKSADKRLILKTFFLNYYMRLILWTFPFQKVHKIACKMGIKHKKDHIEISRLMWAVNATSHYVFKSTCLTKAITSQILLDQYGYVSILRIGVINESEFEAHAWVECEGDVVMGKSEKEYMLLMDIE
jgi:hypothetical protein